MTKPIFKVQYIVVPLGVHYKPSFFSLPHLPVICCTGRSRWYLCPTEQHCLGWKRCLWISTALYLKPYPIPLRTKASLHSTLQCKVVLRPSAIFRCEGSKSITRGRYWDNWISTSRDIGVIMHIYLSTSSFLCTCRNQIHFSARRYCALLWAWPVAIEICLNINILDVVLVTCLAFWAREEVKDHNWKKRSRRTQLLPCLSTESSDRWDWSFLLPICFVPACNFNLCFKMHRQDITLQGFFIFLLLSLLLSLPLIFWSLFIYPFLTVFSPLCCPITDSRGIGRLWLWNRRLWCSQ